MTYRETNDIVNEAKQECINTVVSVLSSVQYRNLSPQEFQSILTFAMHELRLKDRDAAELFGVATPAVNKWRNGHSNAKLVTRIGAVQVLLKYARNLQNCDG